MGTVLGHGHQIAALQRCPSFNHDITLLAKSAPEEETSLHWTVEALCMDSC